MQVICVDDNWNKDMKREGDPKVGDIDEVVEQYQWGEYPIYRLLGRPNPNGYYAPCFIPLSSVDETTFERNYNLETIKK